MLDPVVDRVERNDRLDCFVDRFDRLRPCWSQLSGCFCSCLLDVISAKGMNGYFQTLEWISIELYGLWNTISVHCIVHDMLSRFISYEVQWLWNQRYRSHTTRIHFFLVLLSYRITAKEIANFRHWKTEWQTLAGVSFVVYGNAKLHCARHNDVTLSIQVSKFLDSTRSIDRLRGLRDVIYTSRAYATICQCPSVCPSVCLWRKWIGAL